MLLKSSTIMWIKGQFSSVAQSCPTLCHPMDHSTPGLPVHHQLPELTQSHVHQVGHAIQPSHPLSAPSPPAFHLSQRQGLFQWDSSSHQVAELFNFSFSTSPSNEHSGLIFFRMDWLDLLAVQGTLKSLLQHHSSKASILRHSAFFIVQLSHLYVYITQYITWLYMTSSQTYLFTVSWTNHAVSQLTTAPTALSSSPGCYLLLPTFLMCHMQTKLWLFSRFGLVSKVPYN